MRLRTSSLKAAPRRYHVAANPDPDGPPLVGRGAGCDVATVSTGTRVRHTSFAPVWQGNDDAAARDGHTVVIRILVRLQLGDPCGRCAVKCVYI